MKAERWQKVKRILHEALELPPKEVDAFLDFFCGEDTEMRREVEALMAADGRAGLFLSRPLLGDRPAFAELPAGAEPSGVLADLARHFEESGEVRRIAADELSPDTPSSFGFLSDLGEDETLAIGAAPGDGGPQRTLLVSELACRRREGLREAQSRYLDRLHHQVSAKILSENQGREVEWGDGAHQLLFDRPILAVRHALVYHRALAELSEGDGMTLTARVAIHLCEVRTPDDSTGGDRGEPRPKVMDLETAERLAALAEEGQILMSRDAFDVARQSAAAGFHGVRWLAHGSYETPGLEEPLEVCEVGENGKAPLRPPADTPKGRRRLVQDTIAGWRPAPRQVLPQRPNWKLEKRLSTGGFGEVWLAVNRKARERRVFKFCYDPARLRSLQREITLFRLLKETLGDRDDITRVLDWNFDEAPYFIESEYTEGGSLVDWAESEGGLERIPLATRLDLVAQVATALAAAHSVGVLHKDVKPGNVLVTTDASGRPRTQLSDFGVGLVTERQKLVDAGITAVGLTELPTQGASPGGTRLYMAPELLEGRPATLQADVYALGVVLYQMVVGDFTRALAPGWDREVSDELLREDVAAAVDGSPDRRLSSAAQLAERLRTLAKRRERRALERLRAEEEQRLRESLAEARRRRKLAAVVTTALAVFATVVTFLLYSMNEEAARANREAESVREISDLLIEVIGASDPSLPSINTFTAKEVFERGAQGIESKLHDQPLLRDQPLVRARMLHTLGKIYSKFGNNDRALRLLEVALEIRRQDDGDKSLEVVESLIAVAEVLRDTADLDRAEELSREALDLRRRIESEGPPCVEDCMVHVARVLYEKRDFEAAETAFREPFRLHREPSKTACSFSTSEIRHYLAGVLNAKKDLDGAEEIYRELLLEQVDGLGRDHPDTARTMNSLGITLESEGELDEAEELYEEALRIRSEVLGAGHPTTALTENNLGRLLQKKGEYRAAERLFRESLSKLEKELGGNHFHVAFAKYSLARLFKELGDRDQARKWLLDSLAIYRDTLGEDHPEIVNIKTDMADLLEPPEPEY